MSSVNLHGPGQPNHKTLHVESNLLDIWIHERRHLEESFLKNLIVFFALVVALGAAIPLSVRAARAEARKAQVETRELKKLSSVVTLAETKASAADPTLERQAMVDKSSAKATAFVRAIANVLNAVPDGVVFANIKGEMLGGEIGMTGQADAISAEAGHNTINSFSAAKGVTSAVLSSAKPATELSPKGVEFEFVIREDARP